MVTAFTKLPAAPFVASQIGLNPDENPGTLEIIDGLQNHYFQAQRNSMMQADFIAGLRCTYQYWEFLVSIINEHAAAHIAPMRGLDVFYAGAIGGIDCDVLASENPARFWQTPPAREAAKLNRIYAEMNNAAQFAKAGTDAQFLSMIMIYADLCAQSALMDAMPQNYKHAPLAEVEGVGLAKKLGLQDTGLPLAQTIIETEAKIYKKWRALQPPPKTTLRLVN